jgi:serine/threonine protein phosphatase 1
MRTLVIGDIHGCLTALEGIFELANLRPDDQIIALGDYVDRGPDTRSVVDRMIGLVDSHGLIPLLGNHEEMMMKSRTDKGTMRAWLTFGGRETLQSYSGSPRKIDLRDVPDEHWRFFEQNCIDWHETDTHIFVHGCAHPDLPLDMQSAYALRWDRFFDPEPHVSGKVMICGHTAQSSGVPRNLGHAICLDTWVYGDGWLSCLDIESGCVWQANVFGDLRSAHIDEFLTEPYSDSVSPF